MNGNGRKRAVEFWSGNMEREKQAVVAGVMARKQGKEINDNPYKIDNPLHYYWALGFNPNNGVLDEHV